MGIGSGLGSALGIVDETVYGTLPGSPTWRWYEPIGKQPDLKLVKNFYQGGGLASGRMVEPASMRVVTTRAGTISSLPLEVRNNKFGLILKHIFGGVVVPVQQVATAAYLQTHPLVDNVGRSFDAQVQVVQTDGTVKQFTGRGGKIMSAEFSCDIDGAVMCEITADFQQLLDSDTAGAPSYTSGQWPFNFSQSLVKIGTFASEAAATGVRKWTCKIDRSQSTDRFYANQAGLKQEPLMNDFVNITGSLDVDFTDKTQFADRFQTDANASLILGALGTTAIASTYFPTIQLALPAVFFDDGTPTQDDKGVLKTTYNYEAQYDLTNNPITATYMSTDITL